MSRTKELTEEERLKQLAAAQREQVFVRDAEATGRAVDLANIRAARIAQCLTPQLQKKVINTHHPLFQALEALTHVLDRFGVNGTPPPLDIVRGEAFPGDEDFRRVTRTEGMPVIDAVLREMQPFVTKTAGDSAEIRVMDFIGGYGELRTHGCISLQSARALSEHFHQRAQRVSPLPSGVSAI